MKRSFLPHTRLSSLWAILLALAIAGCGQEETKAPGDTAARLWPAVEGWAVFDKPGKFITALCATGDALWIGTEDNSLWRLDLTADPATPEAWQSFTPKDTATDHVYGLAVDAAGRLWCGTANQGVSVYNGKDWRNYGIFDGCSGEHVFAIAADPDPVRGSVWIGTDRGLVCWTPTRGAPAAPGRWKTYTQADGLPSQQIYAVAVTPAGRVWVGTECDGVAWGDSPYDKWTCVRADAEKLGVAAAAPADAATPGAALGPPKGLPSDLANALAVLRDGTVVASTDAGLGICRAGQAEWARWQDVGKEPWENYARGLAGDASGGLWIATRQKGLARLDLGSGDLKTYTHAGPGTSLPDDYVFAVAVGPAGEVWAGTYGGGLACLGASAGTAPPARPAVAVAVSPSIPHSAVRIQHSVSPLPAPLAVPTLDELNALLAGLAKVPFALPEKQPAVVRIDDDWLTKGDCLGRYGRYWGCWCAICSPGNYLWGAGPEKVLCVARIGPNLNDSLRYWVHWLATQNPNCLEMPPTYYSSRVMKGYTTAEFTRRQAEWCDNGQVYSQSMDGPSLYCTMRIPPGLFRLSLFNFNKDGHESRNRLRDYRLSVRPHTPGQDLGNIADFPNQPEIARARFRDFWGATYKRFLVRGPTEFTIQVDRSHSFNTMLCGVFLDLLDEDPVPYFHKPEEWRVLSAQREKDRQDMAAEWASPDAHARRFSPAPTEAEAAEKLFLETERLVLANAVWWARESRPVYAALLRWHLAAIGRTPDGQDKQRLVARASTCWYQLGQYEKWEAGCAVLGRRTARQIEKTLRWDGHSESCEGMDLQMVLEALGQKP